MKKQLLIALTPILLCGYVNAQSDKFWESSLKGKNDVVTTKGATRTSFPKDFILFDLNSEAMRQTLFSAVNNASKKSVVISLPNAEGGIEKFEVFESSNFDAELQSQFPEIRAFSGKGITDKYATLKLSISPQGIQTMVFRTDKVNEFIEPYSEDKKVYAVYKSQREKGKLAWTCSTEDKKIISDISSSLPQTNKSSAGQLRTLRLAQSCTAEYSNYFGATSSAQVGLVLAAFNATLTRGNGVYEKDLALHLNIVAQSTNVIYYNAATDPYSAAAAGAGGAWNTELQNTLSSSLAGPSTSLATNNGLYDIGHLFGASGGGGNAGCIGCVCTNDTSSPSDTNKGSGFTSPGDGIPQGDNFDIDYVVHEVGHQLGGNHTFTFSLENNSANYEPGSGSTIMGYAGITSRDIQAHSNDYYHARSIEQIQANIAATGCGASTAITHGAPVVQAGLDYTIPMSTPFMLTGSATDAGGGSLTYCWEQYDEGSTDAMLCGDNPSTGTLGDNDCIPVATKTSGPVFRSYSPTASPTRYFPTMSSVLAGSTTTTGTDITSEALPSVARTLNFRLTVRDNVAGQGQTNYDDMIVTVDATRGPLTVTSQNTNNQTWLQNTTQTITWTVNNTNTSAGGANVDILLSTDGGLTYPTVLVAGTPNDGTQTITVPNITAQRARVMVKASGNVFFNVNTKDIAIGYNVADVCNSYSNNTTLTVPDNSPANNSPGTIVSKTISVPTNVTMTDVNVVLSATHSYAWDMVVAMNHPDGTQVGLWNRNCNNASTGFNITFDDGQPAIVCVSGGSPTGTYRPSGSLATLNNKPSNGTWTLLAADYWAGDNGSIGNWSIQICNKQYTLSNPDFEFEDFSLYPNPNNGEFTVKFTSSTGNDIKVVAHDLRGRQVFEKAFANTGTINQNVSLNNVEAGVYLVSVIDGGKKTVKRVVVE